jgi:hypothetical protein
MTIPVNQIVNTGTTVKTTRGSKLIILSHVQTIHLCLPSLLSTCSEHDTELGHILGLSACDDVTNEIDKRTRLKGTEHKDVDNCIRHTVFL